MKGLGETRMAAIGIDVSKHNGVIDWEKIKASGINFAIIRIGHGSDIASQDDSQAERNMNECERLGIPYGVYIYSYALTEEEAESEAQHTLRMIEGRNPVMGVWFDMEDADGYKQKHGIPLDNAHSKLYTDICAVYTSIIQEKGYKAGMFGDHAEDCNCRCSLLQKAKWALDDKELETLKDRAEYFGLDKSKDFEDYKEKYLQASPIFDSLFENKPGSNISAKQRYEDTVTATNAMRKLPLKVK